MGRVEALIFASSEPVSRETLAGLVGRDCSIDLLIDDIRDSLRDRPYKLVSVAGGWQHRTRLRFADAIRSVTGSEQQARALSQSDLLVLAIVAYHQPITRGEISNMTGKDVSRDTIAHLRSQELVASGPRSPQPGAPYTLVKTALRLTAARSINCQAHFLIVTFVAHCDRNIEREQLPYWAYAVRSKLARTACSD